MKQFLTSLLFICLFVSVNAQNKTSVLTKVTATWCPNCGTWGWDYFEELKEVYSNDSKATLLGVHHSGDLRNDVSSWFANNLKFSYQPEFYHNNQDLNVTRNNWEDKVMEMESLVSAYHNESQSTGIGFVNAYTENGEIICNISFDASAKSAGENYFAIYVFENNVENNQSSRGMSLHPNVLRDVIGDSYNGELFTGEDENGNVVFQKEYRMDINAEWDEDNVGLLAVIWKEDNGNYVVENASSVHNIGLLSSSNEILDSDLVSVIYRGHGIEISIDGDDDSELYLFNNSGQLLDKKNFNRTTTIETSQFVPGIYNIQIRQDQKVYTQQVIVTQ